MKIKKMELFALVIAIVLANILIVNTAQADECWRLERQLNKSENMLRRGGDASYMKLWRQSRDHNHEELQKCKKRFGKGAPQITVYSGAKKETVENRNVVFSNINDPQLQQLIKTCNYWINEYNRNASPENLAFRDNACRDVKTATDRITNPQKPFVMEHKRSAKECVKPNNVIDNEVRECMEGLREPNWTTR